MSPPILNPPPPGQSWRWILLPLVLLLLLAAIPMALAAGVWSCVRTGSDVTALRRAAIQASDSRWERQVEFRVGRLLFALGRFGLSFAPLDSDARTALRAVRSVEVTVFQAPDRNHPNRAAILTSADQVMTRRGWERMVGVVDQENAVAVYVPKRPRGQLLHACVLVVNEENLVVVSAETDWTAVAKLVERHRGDFPVPRFAFRH